MKKVFAKITTLAVSASFYVLVCTRKSSSVESGRGLSL